jgi:hypothetical protein
MKHSLFFLFWKLCILLSVLDLTAQITQMFYDTFKCLVQLIWANVFHKGNKHSGREVLHTLEVSWPGGILGKVSITGKVLDPPPTLTPELFYHRRKLHLIISFMIVRWTFVEMGGGGGLRFHFSLIESRKHFILTSCAFNLMDTSQMPYFTFVHVHRRAYCTIYSCIWR